MSIVSEFFKAKVKEQTFTSSGTWVHPRPGVEIYGEAIVIGGGGGGGSGALIVNGNSTTIGNFAQGGGGGGGGQMVIRPFVATANVSVTVGAGGGGGAARSRTSTSQYLTGNNGARGGTSIFGDIRAQGGGEGYGGRHYRDISTNIYHTYHNGGATIRPNGQKILGGGHGGIVSITYSTYTPGISGTSVEEVALSKFYRAEQHRSIGFNTGIGNPLAGLSLYGHSGGNPGSGTDTYDIYIPIENPQTGGSGGGGSAGPRGNGANGGARVRRTNNTSGTAGSGGSASGNTGAGGGGGGAFYCTVTNSTACNSGGGGNGGSGVVIVYWFEL